MTPVQSTTLTTQTVQSTMQSSQADKTAKDVTNGTFKDNLAAKKAAQEFEAMYIGQMLNHMYSGLPTDGYFDGGNAEEIYRGMMVTEYGNMMAAKGGIGMADHVYREMVQMQEGVKK